MIFHVDRIETLTGKRIGTLGSLFEASRGEADKKLLELARTETGELATATRGAVHPFGMRGTEHWKIRCADLTN